MGTQAVSNTNKKRSRAAKSALAIALALLLAFGGTFAWMQVTRAATNEFANSSNPGGRLHDDFVWTSAQKNKDVYVENFTSGDEGENIYVRVQLREYLEAGSTSYPTGATASDHSKWETHLYKDGTHETATGDFHKYFNFTYGGQTTYMPTFNKNKDSLDPDVNGSYRDAGGPFTSYKDYNMLAAGGSYSEKRDAYYDADANDADERPEGSLTAPGAGGAENANYTVVPETHAAKQTPNAEVMSMADWKASIADDNPAKDANKKKACWVYDTDGWAYWSQALRPGEATGLLLNNVTRTGTSIAGDWYYAIDAMGEFATSDAWYRTLKAGTPTPAEGADYADTDYNCFFGRKGGAEHTMSPDAYNLLNNAAGNVPEAAGMSGWVNDVKDKPTANEAAAADGNADAATVAIDGVDYVKLAQTDDNSRALLMRKNLLATGRPFDTAGNIWASSSLRSYLNYDYASSLSADLRKRLVQTTIKTQEQIGSAEFIETSDKVFLLTEADVFKSVPGVSSPTADYFTYGAESLVPTSLRQAKKDGDSVNLDWWLRSPRREPGDGSVGTATMVNSSGGSSFGTVRYARALRPVFWVNLDS